MIDMIRNPELARNDTAPGGQVDRSLVKPAAPGPFNRIFSSCPFCAGFSFGGRPGAGRATSASVKVGYFANGSDLCYHDVIGGDVFSQPAKVLEILLTKYLKAAIGYEGIQRIESLPMPESALREALLNAVTRRDDAVAAPIQIRVYAYRLSIWNPGELPEGWSIKKLLGSHPSPPHNPDGAIFVSIDDGEVNNLRSVFDEVFGPENFIAKFVWEKRTTRENRRVFSFNHDYVMCVAKNKPEFERTRNLLPASEEVRNRYKNPDNDPRGPWQSVSLNAQAGHATKDQFYTITTPGGRVLDPPPGRCWVVTRPKLDELNADNRIWFGESKNNVPRQKLFLSEARDGLTPHTLWTAAEVSTNDSAKKDLIGIFDGVEAFDSPKPTALVRRMLDVATEKDDIVIDFFAGSGTTGHAVMAQNASKGDNRRYILVQFPEPLDPENKDHKVAAEFCKKLKTPLNIAELTKERLRRAARKIREEAKKGQGDAKQSPLLPLSSSPCPPLDLGFRVFKLDSTNIREWEPKQDDFEGALIESIEHLKPDRSEADILYEVLLKLGLDLCVPTEKRSIAGKDVYAIGSGVLIGCLAEKIARNNVEALGQGIVKLHKALAPAGDTTCVFRDSAFADDVAKTNLAAILEQNGIANVRSL